MISARQVLDTFALMLCAASLPAAAAATPGAGDDPVGHARAGAMVYGANPDRTPLKNVMRAYELRKYADRLKFANAEAERTVLAFQIPCTGASDGRFVPLENLLLARLGHMPKRMDTEVDTREGQTRIVDVTSGASTGDIAFEINQWKELRSPHYDLTAVSAACFDSSGDSLWMVR
jgi:hypothetical protein